MPKNSLNILQPLDVGCFSEPKRAYGRFVSDLARVGYNDIDKLDFLADYPRRIRRPFNHILFKVASLPLVLFQLAQNGYFQRSIFHSERLRYLVVDRAANQANSPQNAQDRRSTTKASFNS